MNQEENVKSNCNDDSFWAMARDFYNVKMMPFVILVWSFGIIIIAVAVWAAVNFFNTDDIKLLILYAVIFLVMVTWMNALKIFAWQMIHRNSIKKQIKKLQEQISELSLK